MSDMQSYLLVICLDCISYTSLYNLINRASAYKCIVSLAIMLDLVIKLSYSYFFMLVCFIFYYRLEQDNRAADISQYFRNLTFD